MLFRTLVTPMFYGLINNLGGANLVEVILGVIYGFMNLAIYRMLSRWNKLISFLTVLVINLDLYYQIMLHSVGSDNLFSLTLVLWIVLLFHSFNSNNVRFYLFAGLLTFILVLIRPVGQVLILAGFTPLLRNNLSINLKIRAVLYFYACYFLITFLFSSLNLFRYGDFTVSRTSNAHIPFYRVFSIDHIVSPENGYYSKKLAEAVENTLLKSSPYKDYQINTEIFFKGSDPRMWADLVVFSDNNYGWDTDYAILQKVAFEAIVSHPKEYFGDILNTFMKTFEIPKPLDIAGLNQRSGNYNLFKGQYYERIMKQNLALPSEGLFIPYSRWQWLSSNPGRREVSSDKATRLSVQVANSTVNYPPRTESTPIKSLLVHSKRFFPSIYIFILFALFGNLLRPNPQNMFMIYVMFLGLLVVFITYSSVEPAPEYRLSIDPVFIISGMLGVYNIFMFLKKLLLNNYGNVIKGVTR